MCAKLSAVQILQIGGGDIVFKVISRKVVVDNGVNILGDGIFLISFIFRLAFHKITSFYVVCKMGKNALNKL